MKVLNWLNTQFKKWFIYNVVTFSVLAIPYSAYNYFWLQYTTTQMLRWIFTAGFFGSIVNIVMRPVVGWVTRFLDRRYGKK